MFPQLAIADMVATRLACRSLAIVSMGIYNRYPPRKQLIWEQCQNYVRRPNFLLLQLDNLSTGSRIELKSKLKSLGVSLKTPKSHILKKVFRVSGVSSLQEGIVGFIGIAITDRPAAELREALSFIKTQPKVTLLGAKFGLYTFTDKGVLDLVHQYPSISILRNELVMHLSRPSHALVSSINSPLMLLANLLEQWTKLEGGEPK